MPGDQTAWPAGRATHPLELKETSHEHLEATLLSGCLALAATSAFAADDMKKADPMKKEMTPQECKDYTAMAKKDDSMTKKDAMCADMMKKDGMKKDAAMIKKDEPMKK